MAGNTLYGVAILVNGETLCSKRNTLIELHMIANYAGLSYHHSRTVVYGEIVSDSCTGVNINSCLAVCKFGDNSGDSGYSYLYQFVRHAVVAYCFYSRIAAYYLSGAFGGRVAVVHRNNIHQQTATQFGE